MFIQKLTRSAAVRLDRFAHKLMYFQI